MFNWFWNFLYGISKSMYQIIDYLMSCANMLCGVEPIKYQGVETDFLTFLLNNPNISYGFVAASLIAVALTFLFGVAALIRSMVSEKSNMTPGQVFVKVGKTLLIFIFIPVSLSVLVYFTNVIVQSLYAATLGGSPDGLGRFLAGAFGQNALKSGVASDFYLNKSFNYMSTGNARSYMDLTDYNYFFSWISGICIILSLGSALLMFIDRVISLVVLFLFSPISISTAVVDDGAHFKLWRDQFIVKFLTGYGCIIAINVYTLVIAAVTQNGLVFFDNNLLNDFMKILIIVGGSVSMQRIMALVGNLISAGAGSNELRDNAIAGAQMRGILGRTASGIKSVVTSPYRAARSISNFARDAKQFGLGTAIGQRLGFRTARDYGQMSNVQLAQSRQLMREKEEMRRQSNASFFGAKSSVQNALNGKRNDPKGSNAAKVPAKKDNAIVNNSIANSLKNNKNDKK